VCRAQSLTGLSAAALGWRVDSGFDLPSVFQVDAAAYGHHVASRVACRRIRKSVREVGVGREQQQSRRGAIEPSHGNEPVRHRAEDVEHRRPPFRIAPRRDGAARLVKQQQAERLLRDWGGVDVETRSSQRDEMTGISDDASVDAHPAGENEPTGVASRGGAEFGQRAVERDLHVRR
jgi:hypothetical protein